MNKVVVTGGSAGIGLATAERFAAAGWAVAIVARDETRLEDARALLARHGRPVVAIPADVGDPAAVAAAADRAAAELGGIDAWINNAMATVVARAADVTVDEWARVTAVTYLSQVHGTLAALRHMNGRGAIVQVSSGLALRPAPLQAPYCGAKAAVTGFTDALRAELIADRSPVTLSVVYLPAVDTPQASWARNRTGHEQVLPDPLFDPELAVEAIFTAARTGEREIWVGRSTMMMAAGQHLAPGLADKQAAKMQGAQQGAPMPPRDGNLDAPIPGPARARGDTGGSRTIRSTREFLTSSQRDLLRAGALGGLVAGGAALGIGLARAVPRPLRPFL